MKISLHAIMITILLVAFAFSAHAETRYVSDKLIVTVRSGKGNQFKVLETIQTATPVTVVEKDKEYLKVLTPKGTEGYVKRQYITKSIPKTTQIKQLNIKLNQLEQKLSVRQNNLNSTQTDINSYKEQIETLSVQLKKTQQELKKSTNDHNELLSKADNVVNISNENQQLIEENNLINGEIMMLREENQKFHRTNMIQWFLAGGGVFFGGWLIGKISRKKQRRF